MVIPYTMKKLLFTLGLIGLVFCSSPLTPRASAAAAERSIQERLDDLEAYVNNGARNPSTNAPSKIAGPGPGHNGWMMTSSALVLFMTLPGLALFYGGLVRRKNVLRCWPNAWASPGHHPLVVVRLLAGLPPW